MHGVGALAWLAGMAAGRVAGVGALTPTPVALFFGGIKAGRRARKLCAARSLAGTRAFFDR